MNRVSVTGRLVADPELKTTPDGTTVTSFTVAVHRLHTKDVTDFLEFRAWRGNAEFICRFFRKGSRIELGGTAIQHRWTSEDRTHSKIIFEVDTVDFGESRKASEVASSKHSTAGEGYADLADDAELPFG